jgi:hypothetical protein
MGHRVSAGIAAVAGTAAVVLTIGLESRAAMSMGFSSLRAMSLIALPGLIGSMAIAGGVHAFSLWIAAILNGLLYFGLSWAAASLFNSIRKKFR